MRACGVVVATNAAGHSVAVYVTVQGAGAVVAPELLVHLLGLRRNCGLWRRGIPPEPMDHREPGKAPAMNEIARERQFLELARTRGLRPVGRNYADKTLQRISAFFSRIGIHPVFCDLIYKK